jgi:tetrahydromethanopterin S-methyltransferase subunit B
MKAGEDVINSVSQLQLTPIHMAVQGIFNNVFYGIVLSIPVAAIVCRNNVTGRI